MLLNLADPYDIQVSFLSHSMPTKQAKLHSEIGRINHETKTAKKQGRAAVQDIVLFKTFISQLTLVVRVRYVFNHCT